jgi:hypothetical protein
MLSQENRYLQEFCKLQRSAANYRAAFTQHRPLVRSQHRPLKKCLQMAEKEKPLVLTPGAIYCNRIATRTAVG